MQMLTEKKWNNGRLFLFLGCKRAWLFLNVKNCRRLRCCFFFSTAGECTGTANIYFRFTENRLKWQLLNYIFMRHFILDFAEEVCFPQYCYHAQGAILVNERTYFGAKR